LQPIIQKASDQIRKSKNHKLTIDTLIVLIVVFLLVIWFNIGPLEVLLPLTILLTVFSSIAAAYYIKFDPTVHLEGLTVWSINKAKEKFKGGKVNDKEGHKVHVMWRLRKDEEDVINLSHEDMKKMAAEVGDMVYLCDARKYLGGLKSVHSRIGEPHDEAGIVYISKEHKLSALFQEDKILYAEKEM
jgi:SSS family solute:Na+ symporter